MTDYSNEGVMALIRYNETIRHDSLYKDSSAHYFLNENSHNILKNILINLPNFEQLITVRHRIFLDEINFWLKMINASQLVSLGAGYCTLISDYIKESDGVLKGFEIDRKEVFANKIDKLGGNYSPTCISYNFKDYSLQLGDNLKDYGFKSNENTVFYMEGVLYYFNNDDIINFISDISILLKDSKSILIFDIQVGSNLLTIEQIKTVTDHNISDNYQSLSYWCTLLERYNLRIMKFSNLATLDSWGRMISRWETVTSSIFVVCSK